MELEDFFHYSLEFEVMHLPDLINDVQFPSLFCLSFLLELEKYFNLQHYMITRVLPHHQVA